MERDEAKNGAWEDVTEGCALTWGYKGHEIKVVHDGIIVAIVGQRVNHINSGGLGKAGDKAYRVTVTPDSDPLWSGKIKVEHFIPDPEPVIAYKAVRVEDGEYLSVLTGSVAGEDFHGSKGKQALRYIVGESTSALGAGIFCMESLEWAKVHYVEGMTLRASGPVAILEVEGIGSQVKVGTTRPEGSVNYPSVKVLSVAWEEEKKEEWVDVTAECKAEFTVGCVRITHNGIHVVDLGQKAQDLHVAGYRVSSKPNSLDEDYAGFIKVEKRND